MQTLLRQVELLALMLLVSWVGGCLKDIRPATLRDPASPSEERAREERGRALLEEAASAHGGRDAWLGRTTTELVLTDCWYGMARLFNQWPDAEVRVRLRFVNGTLDSRCTFLEGDEAGNTWGVQHYATYTQSPGEPAVFEQDDDILFLLPTIQYFTVAPFRLLEAPIVRYAGETIVGSNAYELVYVTWGSAEANKEYDQYVIYVDPATKRIAKMHYTVRDITRFLTGAVHYEDYRSMNGFILPFSQRISGSVTDDDPMHHIRLESVAFDTAPRDAFYPDSSKVRAKH